MDKKILFKHKQILNDSDDKFVTVILKEKINLDHFCLEVGLPVLTSYSKLTAAFKEREAYEKGEIKSPGYRSTVKILTKYPTRDGSTINGSFSANVNKLHVVQGVHTCFANNHIIKEIDSFDIEKVDSLIEHVKTFGSITLMFKNGPGAAGAVDVVKLLTNRYKLSAYVASSFDRTSSKNMTVAMDIVTIENVFPIFNHKKKDGIYILLYIICEEKSQYENLPILNSYIGAVATNHTSNIFELDGSIIRDRSKISNQVYNKTLSLIKATFKSTECIKGSQRKPNVDDDRYRELENCTKKTITRDQALLIQQIVSSGIPGSLLDKISRNDWISAVKKAVINRDPRDYKLVIEIDTVDNKFNNVNYKVEYNSGIKQLNPKELDLNF